MTTTIDELISAVWAKIVRANKVSNSYTLEVRHFKTIRNGNCNLSETIQIEYSGKSSAQPYLLVTGLEPKSLLRRFSEELKEFEPLSIAQVEEINKRKVVA